MDLISIQSVLTGINKREGVGRACIGIIQIPIQQEKKKEVFSLEKIIDKADKTLNKDIFEWLKNLKFKG